MAAAVPSGEMSRWFIDFELVSVPVSCPPRCSEPSQYRASKFEGLLTGLMVSCGVEVGAAREAGRGLAPQVVVSR